MFINDEQKSELADALARMMFENYLATGTDDEPAADLLQAGFCTALRIITTNDQFRFIWRAAQRMAMGQYDQHLDSNRKVS